LTKLRNGDINSESEFITEEVVMPLAATSTEQLWFLNTLHTVRVRHDEGEDGISVLESLAPHGASPPLHVHETDDEIFHVLEGFVRALSRPLD
jgi:quercetin dioxygenase-like cupin family protein